MSQYRVTAHSLNVRSDPSLDSEVIDYLKENDIVPLLGKSNVCIK